MKKNVGGFSVDVNDTRGGIKMKKRQTIRSERSHILIVLLALGLAVLWVICPSMQLTVPQRVQMIMMQTDFQTNWSVRDFLT